MQEEEGGSIYLRLSTRPIEQPQRAIDAALRDAIVAGGYWLKPPAPGVDFAIAYAGAVAPEAIAAYEAIQSDIPGAGLLSVTSADRLHEGWVRSRQGKQPGSHVEDLLAPLAPGAALVTLTDAHPAALSWLGAVRGQRVQPLGVDHFGQSGDLPDLYRV